MSAETNPANAYLRTRVLTASPAELRLLLLDGAIKFARQGAEGLSAKNYEQSFTGLSQCRAILVELMTTMKREHDPELCDRLSALYTFMISEMLEASMEKKPERVGNVIKLLEFERETWAMLMGKLATEKTTTAATTVAAADAPAERVPLSVRA